MAFMVVVGVGDKFDPIGVKVTLFPGEENFPMVGGIRFDSLAVFW